MARREKLAFLGQEGLDVARGDLPETVEDAALWGPHLPSEDAPWIFAEVFNTSDPDELAEFAVQVREWESKPESE